MAPTRTTPAPSTTRDSLTPRQWEIVCRVGRGLTQAQIARELSIEPGTVKKHLQRAYKKVDARDTAAVLWKVLQEVAPGSETWVRVPRRRKKRPR